MGVGEGDDTGMGERKMERETGAGEKKRERETGIGDRKIEKQDQERDRDRERDRGEREKITNSKKFMEFYPVVLHFVEWSEARQWIVARQVSCYNTVTRDKVGKKKIERETGWEREKDITRGGGDRNGPVPL